MTARFLVGDVFDRMAELPDASVDLCSGCARMSPDPTPLAARIQAAHDRQVVAVERVA